jgi:hypothetical protein
MLIENHFVYRNNDVNNSSLENNYSLNALGDNEQMARRKKERIIPNPSSSH